MNTISGHGCRFEHSRVDRRRFTPPGNTARVHGYCLRVTTLNQVCYQPTRHRDAEGLTFYRCGFSFFSFLDA